jgi:hypothetical protein
VSNIHSPSAAHGIDDEFNYGQPTRCQLCWSRAKTKFFTPGAAPRRGRTLARVYAELFEDAHGQGNSH